LRYLNIKVFTWAECRTMLKPSHVIHYPDLIFNARLPEHEAGIQEYYPLERTDEIKFLKFHKMQSQLTQLFSTKFYKFLGAESWLPILKVRKKSFF